MPKKSEQRPGYFGPYGGRFVPETLMAPLDELARAYDRVTKKRRFQRRLTELLTHYAGRPTPLYLAERLSEHLGGVRIYLKREDLLHTGAHKINNAIGQALLAREIGGLSREAVAEGFLMVAVENMARAIKRITLERGFDVGDYTLVCFGGAGGQHVCLVADALGIDAGRVGVKATTTEGLGFVGRREGIAAQAVCVLVAAPAGGAGEPAR